MDDNSFFSIDRLVEFGMGMAVAQQMVKTMNESMTNMHIPGAMNSMEKPKEKFFYAMIEGNQAGPFSDQELARLIAERKVSKETYIWAAGLCGARQSCAPSTYTIFPLSAISPTPIEDIGPVAYSS